MNEPVTINGWLKAHGPINLPDSPKPTQAPESEGILNAVSIVCAVLAWCWAFSVQIWR